MIWCCELHCLPYFIAIPWASPEGKSLFLVLAWRHSKSRVYLCWSISPTSSVCIDTRVTWLQLLFIRSTKYGVSYFPIYIAPFDIIYGYSIDHYIHPQPACHIDSWLSHFILWTCSFGVWLGAGARIRTIYFFGCFLFLLFLPLAYWTDCSHLLVFSDTQLIFRPIP